MEANIHLVVHNVLSILAAIIMAGMAIFTYLNGRRETANITFALVLVCGVVFTVSHVIGVNVADPELSRRILMFNLIMFIAAPLQLHSAIALTGKSKGNGWFVLFNYLAGVAFIILFLIFQDSFLLPSVPKTYFLNYYEPGPMNWTRIFFLDAVAVAYSAYLLFSRARVSETPADRKRYGYFAWVIISTYSILFIPNFLVYDVKIDPSWGMLFSPAFAVVFLYLAVRYEIFSVRVVAKRAFLYSLAVGMIGGLIALLNYSNRLIENSFLGFSTWIMSLVSAFLVVTASVFVWRRLRENDLLKYEFVTTMTHKFRTPLTGIKWATEELSKGELPTEAKTQVDYIRDESAKLTELTGLLMNMSGMENDVYDYRAEESDLSIATEEVVSSLAKQSSVKGVSTETKLVPDLRAVFDTQKTRFVLQVLIENAIHYTPEGGRIEVLTSRDGKMAVCSVRDSGIGLSREDTSRVFSKFYRSHRARLADTEGVGIGLYAAKQIVRRQGGKIWAESEGEGKGSTFTFTIPLKK